MKGHKATITALALHPNGSLLISGDTQGTIKIWSLPEGQLQVSKEAHKGSIHGLVLDPDGQGLLSSGSDKKIQHWSLPNASNQTFFDLDACSKEVEGIKVETVDNLGQTVTYTLPCGSPIPAGATCICNCVPGTWGVTPVTPTPPKAPRTRTYHSHYWYPN